MRPTIGSARRKLGGSPRAPRRSYHYYTDIERGHERIIQTATSRVEEFDKASEAVRLHLCLDQFEDFIDGLLSCPRGQEYKKRSS